MKQNLIVSIRWRRDYYEAVIGDGGDFDMIVGYQPQQQHLLAETEAEYVDNCQQLVADIHQEEVENNDNFTAVNYDHLDNVEIPQKCKKGKWVADVTADIYGRNLLAMKLTVMNLVIYIDFSTENSTPLTCFQTLLFNDVKQDGLLIMINDFPNLKILKNNSYLRWPMYAK